MLVIHFIFGCVVGSFLCLVAERIPVGQSILFPASHCSFCHEKLKVFELVPLMSILYLRFRCRYCKHKLSSIYFFSELFCGLLFLLIPLKATHSFYFLFFLLMAIILSLTDIFYLTVEPKIFYPLSILLGLWHIYLALPLYFVTSLFVFFALHSLNYFLPDSVGGGDIFLLTLWGALIGGESLVFLLLIASSSGLLFLLLYQYLLKKELRQLPFVPFLSIGLTFYILYN